MSIGDKDTHDIHQIVQNVGAAQLAASASEAICTRRWRIKCGCWRTLSTRLSLDGSSHGKASLAKIYACGSVYSFQSEGSYGEIRAIS